jgi:hypothetical protein
MSFRDVDESNPSTRFFERKAVLVIISLEGIMTFILLVTGMVFPNTDFAYGQFFDQSDARSNVTNSSKFLLNSTTSEKSNVSGLVLLIQKLNNASFGYRVLEGQVKNIGNSTAKSVVVTLTTYDKNKGIIGTQYTYPHARTLKPDHKSTFKMTVSIDNFKGMQYYEISLEWKKPDGSKGYVENAKIYKK